jgi:ABC-type glycerol-3-phosphate transport system permease component
MSRPTRTILVFLLGVILVVELAPILYMFMSSLKSYRELVAEPFSLPSDPSLENYSWVWRGERTQLPFSVFFRNSALVTTATITTMVVVAALAGYALARGRFPGNRGAERFFLMTLAVPAHVMMIPVYIMMGKLGLRDSLLGLTMIYVTIGIPFAAILFRAYFLTFPQEIEDAARIDGCSRLGAFFRVVMPMSANAIASVVIVNINWIWSELFYGLVLIHHTQLKTLSIGISNYETSIYGADESYPALYAAMCIATIPMLIVYFLFQRRITKGLTMGAFR